MRTWLFLWLLVGAVMSADPVVSWSAATSSVSEGGSTTIGVTLSGSSTAAITLNITASSTSATLGTDANLTVSSPAGATISSSGDAVTLVLPAGATSGTLTLTAVRESTASESDEDVLLTFDTPGVGAGYTLGAPVVHKATIIDVVDATLLPLPGKGSATEDASPAQLRLTLNPSSDEDRLVNLTFSSGTATAADWAGFAEFTLTRLTAGENIDTFTGSATHGTATGAILYQKINHGIGVPATLRLVMVANPNEDTNIKIKAGPAAEKTLTFKTNADASQNDVAIVANHPSQTMENLRAKLDALAITEDLDVSLSAMGRATSLPIAAGAEPVQLMIEAVDDSIIESNEVGTFALASGTGYLPVTGSSSVVVTFVSDDVALPVVTLVPAAAPDAIATEGSSSDTAAFLLKRDMASASQLTGS